MRYRLGSQVVPSYLKLIEDLTQRHARIVRAPLRRALIAALVLAVVVALLVARGGTVRTRVTAVVVTLVVALVSWLVEHGERRRGSAPERAIARLAGRVAPQEVARVRRGLALVARGDDGGTSRELAELFVTRAVSALPSDAIVRGARREAKLARSGAVVATVGALATVAILPLRVVEGAAVLLSRDGVAPVTLAYLTATEVVARPPEYLRMDERRVDVDDATVLPHGTLVTVRGTPVHAGRRLMLSDGRNEVPFVDDGLGHVVARWPLAASARLDVVARFGDVVIRDPRPIVLEDLPDAPPSVELSGAPRQVVLAGDPPVAEVPVHYEASDDHGLREVHLVLRSGAREERRILARLDTETRADRGGYVLRTSDPFVRRSHVPVEVRVEARDNDPLTGPKWGASASITLVPPAVGELEARRAALLVKLRDRATDELAQRLEEPFPEQASARAAYLQRVEAGSKAVSAELEAALAPSQPLRVPARIAAMLRAQAKKERAAVDAERASPSAPAHALAVRASERLVLAVDGTLRGLSFRDARDAARELADVADDLALGCSQSLADASTSRGDARIDAAVAALDAGRHSLLALGALGRDLGEIIESGLARVQRARQGRDLAHAELAARDLAARLAEPDPSFGAQGRSGRAGGESGGARGTPAADSEGEGDVERAFNLAAQELEGLAQEHAGGVGRVEQALRDAERVDDAKAFVDDGRRRAAELRRALEALPEVGGAAGSWSNKAAQGRDHGERMARALEQGAISDAVESGREAEQSLADAERALRGAPQRGADEALARARRALAEQVRWAERAREHVRRSAAARARGSLDRLGDAEQALSERARALADRAKSADTLPQASLDALRDGERSARDAARALKAGDAERGLSLQRDAQRKLDVAREALGEESDGEAGSWDEATAAHGHTDIPRADAHKGPEEFRRRVLRGLGRGGEGKLRRAVERYAEGLLR